MTDFAWYELLLLAVALWLLVGAYLHYWLHERYVYIFAVKRADRLHKTDPSQPKLSVWVLRSAIPKLLVGYFADWLLHVFWHSIICLDFQVKGTVSSRLERYNTDRKTARWVDRWRLKWCDLFEPFLNPFDPAGTHIGDGGTPSPYA